MSMLSLVPRPSTHVKKKKKKNSLHFSNGRVEGLGTRLVCAMIIHARWLYPFPVYTCSTVMYVSIQ